jgi:hypothetical protein
LSLSVQLGSMSLGNPRTTFASGVAVKNLRQEGAKQ